jgi:putative NIF3 family GTP cyclohydrolase 1 type 2
MGGLSGIAEWCACLGRRQGVGWFVFDIERVGVVGMRVISTRLALLPPCRAFRCQRADVETLAKEVDALQVGQALDKPADPVVHGEPGLVGPGVPVAATPATHRFLEGWGESAVASPTVGSRIGRHGTDSNSDRDNAWVRLSEIMAMANRLAGCAQTPPDSQVYLDGEVRRVFVGIDVDIGELLLARALGADGVIAHHPIGSHARLGLATVIEGHEAQMRAAGIPAEVAHEMMLARQRPVTHSLHTSNYDRVVDAARQLEMPVMNIHLAADLIGRQFFIDFIGRAVGTGVTTVGGLIGELKTIPEMQASLIQPELWLGEAQNPVGRWVVQMAAGTNGGAPVYRTYYEHGVDTILAMHIDERDLKELEQLQRPTANLVITGHIPSDSIGMNRVIDALEKQGIEVIAGSGVIRP